MPWRSTSVMNERIKFVVLGSRAGANLSELCREFGISRTTGYRWLNRFNQSGTVFSVFDRSRRPHHSPTRTPNKLVGRVIALRKRYGWGSKKLQPLLLREGLEVKRITIDRILKRNGLIKKKIRDRKALKRFERRLPNQLWQMDFKGESAVSDGYCYPLSILDDHSRFALGLYALRQSRAKLVQNCLICTFKNYGLPAAMLMDHGPLWWSTTNGHGLTWLSVWLLKQDIRLIYSRIRHPQTQGKVERFHRTLDDDIYHHGKPKIFADWQKSFDRFLYDYNYIRPHEALEMDVPSDHYYPSQRQYQDQPAEWEYPQGAIVKRLNSQGCVDYQKRRYFVCEALCNEPVQIETIQNKLLVRYRRTYIREIDLKTGKGKPIVKTVSKNQL